jgi:tetratricopeptide (TPR) repeat protein
MTCAAQPGPRALFSWVSLCVVAVVVAPPATRAGATTAPPATPPAAPPAWMQALGEYARDPVANRGALRVLEREDPASLPPVALLALADARLRGRRTQSAERLFEAVRSQGADEPWASYAELGLGGIALRSGDLDAARTYYERVAASPGPSRASAQMVLATIASLDGDAEGSVAAFEALASDVTAPAGLQAAGRLGAAYARYWAGDFVGAAAAFDAAASGMADARLLDDARYGAAMARWRAGDESGARELLAGLASTGSGPGGRRSRQLLTLDLRALLRNGFEQYRRGPLQVPETSLATLLDLDGPVLARTALKAIERGDRLGSVRARDAGVRQLDAAPAPPVAGERVAGAENGPADAGRAAPGAPAATSGRSEDGRMSVLALVGLLLAASAAAVAWYRSRAVR